jgi:hypothetical protein
MADSRKVFRDELAAPGFIKTSATDRPTLTGEQRSALIRKGNQLFNEKRYEDAKRVFVTAHYTDGLVRLGDYYAKQNNMLEAIRMYWLAPERRKIEYLAERMAGIVRSWLKEEEVGGQMSTDVDRPSPMRTDE